MNINQYKKLSTIYLKSTDLLNELEAKKETMGDDDDAIEALEAFVLKLEHDLLVNKKLINKEV